MPADTKVVPPHQAPPVPDSDQRPVRPAAGARAHAYLHLHGGWAVGPVAVRELSAGGATLVLAAPLPRRSAAAVTLYDRASESWLLFPVRGLSLARGPAGECLLEVAFTPELTDDRLRAILS